MNIAETRLHLATDLTAALTGHEVTIHEYKPAEVRAMTGWIQLGQVDRQNVTFGRLRLSVECPIWIATDRTDFERMADQLAAPLLAAVQAAGGRNVTIQALADQTGAYHLSAKFYSESSLT